MGKVFFVFIFFAQLCIGRENSFVQLDKNSSFLVDTTNISKDALPAIRFSLALIDSVISTDIPIRVSIDFNKTSRSNVIATGEATSFEIGFSDLALSNFFYPISLAEKIAGKEINGSSSADIIIIINKELDWHYDITTNDIGVKFDFITLFTHEMIHGLGFQSMVSVISNTVDTSTNLSIFDAHIVDKNGLHLYPNYFKEGEDASKSLITSDTLFFTNNNFSSLFIDSRIPLYAPNSFSSGNSIHHLNSQTDSLPPFRLMRPAFRIGEYQRYIDPYTRGILLALGWTRPNLVVEKQYDVDSISAGQTLVLDVPSPINNLVVEYSFDQFRNYKTLTTECSNELCSVYIPALEFDHTVNYRIKYTDKDLGNVVIPCDSCSISYFVGEDIVKPTLTNFSVSPVFVGTEQALVKYTVSDNTGIVDVCLNVMVNGETVDSVWSNIGSTQSIQDSLVLPSLIENDTLIISLLARDRSQNFNHTSMEKKIIVIKLGDIRYSYSTDFENAKDDFNLDGFQIVHNQNFNSTSLDTKHPYIAPNVDQDSLHTYAILKPRIVIDQTHYLMSFDEIVMVEPQETGKRFGEFGFWDFVSVEGSNDNGLSWHIFNKEGYDATYNEIWHLSYLNNIVIEGRNKNSKSVPTADMYRKHTINLVENKYLHKGDTIIIRFKLTSDAFSVGWGWSIDNLVIQEGAGLQKELGNTIIDIYPNPFSSCLSISPSIINSTYRIVSLMGATVQSGSVIDNTICTNDLTDGLYLLEINDNGSILTQRIIKNTFE